MALCLMFNLLAQNSHAESLPKNDLKSPHNAIWAHLYYLQADSYDAEQAIYPFKLEKNDKIALELANHLLQIYDWKGLYVQMDRIPRDSMYIDSLDQRNVYYPFKDALPDVYLTKQGDEWVYAQHTLDRIPALHKEMGLIKSLILTILPKIGHNDFLGLEVWQYTGIALIIILFFLVVKRNWWYIFRCISIDTSDCSSSSIGSTIPTF